MSVCGAACRDELVEKQGTKPGFLVQGTLYPDVIESCPPPGSGAKHSHTIKSHHNVGGLPKDLQFELIEPLRELFKDEVRKIGRVLGVPEVRRTVCEPEHSRVRVGFGVWLRRSQPRHHS